MLALYRLIHTLKNSDDNRHHIKLTFDDNCRQIIFTNE